MKNVIVMGTVRVSSKWRIIIPKALRESLHIKTGAEIVIPHGGGRIETDACPAFEKTSHRNAAGILQWPGRRYLGEEKSKRAVGHMIETQDKVTKVR